jgi:hypothetical protein
MPRKIIGLMGAIGSGKDTIADFLTTRGFRRLAFAKKVKDVAAIVFGWDRELLEGRTQESREWRECVDPFWGIRPRAALQKIGTEMFREHICDDVWIKGVVQEIQATEDDVVVTDCRFENEIEAIKAAGGTILFVQRDEPPAWAEGAASGSAYDPGSGIHVTDWNTYVLRSLADTTVDNSGSLEDLYNNVDRILSEWNT